MNVLPELFATFVLLITSISISYEKNIASHAVGSAVSQCAEPATSFRFG